ncbi:MAG: TonB-dependent receptor [Gammaproteobacteria bacterium]|nr:TonB-dependent receptor [Gammaproteobacteria bacterium]MCF6364149.1 TonB-dependent receptor [Gammaproteobacteria bacterium]
MSCTSNTLVYDNAFDYKTILRKALLPLAITVITSGQALAGESSNTGAVKSTPVVVTATRFNASIDTAPVNVITISAEDIANSGANSIADVLRYQAGVNVSSLFGINGSGDRIDLGGFGENGGSNTLILLNGRRLNDLDLASANLATIPLHSVAQIEIIQGSASVLYGDNAVGGVINIVTKSAFDAESGNVALEFGTFNTRRLTAGLQKMAGDTALSLNIDSLKSDGYRDSNTLENTSLITEVSREDDGWQRGLRYQQSWEDTQLPGSLNEPDYEADPSQAGAFPYDATERRYSIEGFIDSEGMAAEIALRNKHQETSYGSVSDLETLSFTPRLRRQYGSHRIIAGVDVYRSTLDAIATWNSQYVTQKSDGIYLTDAIGLGRQATLNLGIRRQLIEVRAGNAPVGSDRRNDGITTWDVSLSRKHHYGATNYLRVAKSFRAPLLDEMWNYTTGVLTLIKPQTARHYEIGTRQTYANGIRMNINLFRMDLEDEIAYAYDHAPFPNASANVNLDKTRRDGLNLGLKLPLGKLLNLQAGYAWRKATYRSGANKGKDVPLVPSNKFTLDWQFTLTPNSHLGFEFIHTDSRYFGNDDANAGKKMEAYQQLDINYRYEFGDWHARLQIQNATNIKTADTGFYRANDSNPYNYYSLPERAAYLQLGTSF